MSTIHPAQVAIRTYLLSLGLSVGPLLLTATRPGKLPSFVRSLKRELRYDALAFSMATAVGGGALLREVWRRLVSRLEQYSWFRKLSTERRDLLANILSAAIGLSLLHSARPKHRKMHSIPGQNIPYTLPTTQLQRSLPTVDLTTLLFVRAADALLQSQLLPPLPKVSGSAPAGSLTDIPKTLEETLQREKWQRLRKKRKLLCTKIDAFVFWACSARIMWCWFYQPQRLPHSYVKWIDNLAHLDHRLLNALRDIKSGKLKYGEDRSIALASYAHDLGYPTSWGDVAQLPPFGGKAADETWERLGVHTRSGRGGIPCEVVHGYIGTSSCARNSAQRWLNAMVKAILIYIPAHFIPILITRPHTLLQPTKILTILKAVTRSATFLSTFISSFYFAVCLTRTVVLARLFPGISHNFWDSHWGCIMAGCLACGQSIFIEDGKRRGEMALYVLPRAFKSCIPTRWLKNATFPLRLAERVTFILSLGYLLTTATHRPDSLRGLSRWALAFIMRGPNAGFWKRKRSSTPVNSSIAPTPNGDAMEKKII